MYTEKRQGLKTQADYQDLFSDYRLELPNRKKGLERLKKVIESNHRIALTCFEAEPHRCHRHCVSDFLAREHPTPFNTYERAHFDHRKNLPYAFSQVCGTGLYRRSE